MGQESCTDNEHPDADAPLHVGAKDVLVHQSDGYGCVDAEKPHVAREPVEHPAYERFLAGEPCHLSVGAVAEVGRHEQCHSEQVVHGVGIMEHPSCGCSEKYRKYGYGIGVYAEPVPEKCEH